MSLQLIPEWSPSEAIILAWPHEDTDWAPWLDEVRNTYVQLIDAINNTGAGVLLLCAPHCVDDAQSQLSSANKVLILPADYNDTWARDYAFLTCQQDNQNIPVEFVFNGWGNKFDASKDNQVNKRFLAPLCRNTLVSSPLVAEGGALEINTAGHLLSTASCLYNPERNGDIDYPAYAQTFYELLGAQTFTVLTHGHLEGDDTDGHIDTLVRFTPSDDLVIQASDNRPDDSHYSGLSALVTESKAKFPSSVIHALPLPLMYSEDGDRLPASYANYLVCNNTVLAPVYLQPEDDNAIETLNRAYPEHQVTAINCAPLVQQYGSLHCITMQVPQGTLKPEVLTRLQAGVSVYEY